MSDKDRQKKEGHNKGKTNQARREEQVNRGVRMAKQKKQPLKFEVTNGA